MMHTEQLQRICTEIIHADELEEEQRSAALLSGFFSEWQLKHIPGFQEKGRAELSAVSGIAISTVEAAHCTTDYLRTARFIKAVHAAVNELIRRFPGQRLRILYAGCGPYATLLTPLLPFFSPEQLEPVLLDINACSLESARQLITQLGLSQYNISFAAMDATQFVEKEKFHLILTETMFEALIREPQVAVTEHLKAQLIPGGIFIPEEIILEAVCTSWSREPYLKSNEGSFVLPPIPEIPKRLKLATVFSISSSTDFRSLTNGTPCQIESDYFKIPEEATKHPDVCIFTLLRIFGSICLHPAESLITNPHCVASLLNMKDHSHFKLIYDYRTIPRWICEMKK